MCVCSDGASRLTFGGSLVRNARLGDFDMPLLECETFVLET